MADDRALRLVLDLRQKEEDKAQEEYAKALSAIASFERQIAQLQEFFKTYADELAGSTQQGMDINIYRSYQGFLNKLDQVTKRQEQALETMRGRAENLRLEYLEKQKARKIIESLLEKHRIEQARKEAQAEQKLTDDLVSSKQARILIDRQLQDL